MQKNAILFKRLTNNLKNTATLKTLNTKLLNTLTTTFPNPLRLKTFAINFTLVSRSYAAFLKTQRPARYPVILQPNA